jgi:large subunit ribosomal protein L32
MKAPNVSKCPQCGAPILSHQACLACGSYKGKQVIKLKEKKKGQK